MKCDQKFRKRININAHLLLFVVNFYQFNKDKRLKFYYICKLIVARYNLLTRDKM